MKREEVSELVLIVVMASRIAKIVARIIGFSIRSTCTTPLVDNGARAEGYLYTCIGQRHTSF